MKYTLLTNHMNIFVEEEHYIFHCWCIHDVEYIVAQEESTNSAENVVTLSNSLVVHENGHWYGEEELAVSGIESPLLPYSSSSTGSTSSLLNLCTVQHSWIEVEETTLVN